MTDSGLQHAIPRITPQPDIQQRRAAVPEHMVWVGASAGSGKTKVLTDRVLRLLLPDPDGRWPGTRPYRILCITFTKAAAAEMALRVQRRLSDWAIWDEPRLYADLERLLGAPPSPEVLSAARRLFSEVLEAPGGLNLMTIHSFCQSILGRFPIEAEVTPHFNVLDEQTARDILSGVVHSSLLAARSGADPALHSIFDRLAILLSLGDLETLLLSTLSHSRELEHVCDGHSSYESLYHQFQVALDLTPDDSAESIAERYVSACPEEQWRAYIPLLQGPEGIKASSTCADAILYWLSLTLDERRANLGLYRDAFLAKAGTVRSMGKKLQDGHPELINFLESERERSLAFDDHLGRLAQARSSADLIWLAYSILLGYSTKKRGQNALDFTDLIAKTRHLLENTEAAWVHYKLDGGIDHILVDEAQDTNPDQWAIIRALSHDFFSGTARDTVSPRSLFVVGDEKQSIFSFHGAAPDEFARMKAYFEARTIDAARVFDPVSLDVSFRSTPPVLHLVDTVFDDPALQRHIGLSSPLVHYSSRNEESGLVELHPIAPLSKSEVSSGWVLPFSNNSTSRPTTPLAQTIAMTIQGWLDQNELLPSKGRPIQPGDILILVQSRSALVHDLIRELKRRNIAVSGIDRMVLGDQIAVQDLLALARFVRLTDDDLSLASVLKSPFIRFDEDQLMALALNRGGSLWDALGAAFPAVRVWLQSLIESSSRLRPFEFFSAALTAPCPADPAGSGWRSFVHFLGEDCLDPLDEFLSHALRLEGLGTTSLEALMSSMEKQQLEIKREMEEAGSQIRIMTVHASKGLEAPIVILPDTTKIPERRKVERLFWPERSGTPIPLWAPNAAYETRAYKDYREAAYQERMAEYSRLLYVALTRPRDRLYVFGAQGRHALSDESWYHRIETAFHRMPAVEHLPNGILRFVHNGTKSSSTAAPSHLEDSRVPMSCPAWLTKPIPTKLQSVHMLTPSKLDHGGERVLSPFEAGNPLRFKRGTLTHKLLQILPDLPESRWEETGRAFLDRYGHDFGADVQAEILFETLRVLRDPVFGDVFGPGSMAEVPVTGLIDDSNILSGQIDRIVIQDEKILIVDYKTNRPSPRDPSDIPLIYIEQLRAYRVALARIYPSHNISCALLWTDQPLLMPVVI